MLLEQSVARWIVQDARDVATAFKSTSLGGQPLHLPGCKAVHSRLGPYDASGK